MTENQLVDEVFFVFFFMCRNNGMGFELMTYQMKMGDIVLIKKKKTTKDQINHLVLSTYSYNQVWYILPTSLSVSFSLFPKSYVRYTNEE